MLNSIAHGVAAYALILCKGSVSISRTFSHDSVYNGMVTSSFDPHRLQDDAGWEALLRRLPPDLDRSAFQELALFRHRGFANATLLLRLILAYACGLSMPVVTSWAAAQRLVTLTPEALHHRIKKAHRWLSTLTLYLLALRAQATAVMGLPLNIRLIDGTHAPRPGAKGTDWRIHCSLNLRTQQMEEIKVTAETVGESLSHFTPQVGDLFMGDRNFGTRQSVWHVIQHGADVLVRFIVQNFPLPTRTGTVFPLWEALHTLAPNTSGEWEGQTKPVKRKGHNIPAMPGRLVALRLPPEAALKAREQHRKRRQRNGDGSPGAATVEGWEYVVFFTTLSARLFPTEIILALYRFRWQIELAFKRYKSICGLAQVRTKLATRCQTVLWAKLLLIILLEDLGAQTETFPPCAGGCDASRQSVALDDLALAEPGRLDRPAPLPHDTAGTPAGVGIVSHRYLDQSTATSGPSHEIPAGTGGSNDFRLVHMRRCRGLWNLWVACHGAQYH